MANIIFLIPSFYTGGAQRSIARITQALSGYHNVYLCVFNTEYPIFYNHGGTFLSLNVCAGKGLTGKAIKFYQRIIRFKKFKGRYEIDLTISFLEGADYVSILSGGRDKKIISIRGSKKFDENIKGIMGWIRRKLLMPSLYRRADAIVTTNDHQITELRNYLKIKKVPVKTIYNFYDKSEISSLLDEGLSEQAHELFKRFKIISSHGRVAREKGYQHLIRIFSKVKIDNPELKLMLIGEGDYSTVLKDICEQAGLNWIDWNGEEMIFAELIENSDILFLGFQDNPLKFLKRSILFVMTSSSEGFPNALCEALFCSLPVISTDCPSGPREIMAPEVPDFATALSYPYYGTYGILFPNLTDKIAEDNYQSWVSGLRDVLENDSLLKELKGRAKDRADDFTKESAINDWLTVINQLV